CDPAHRSGTGKQTGQRRRGEGNKRAARPASLTRFDFSVRHTFRWRGQRWWVWTLDITAHLVNSLCKSCAVKLPETLNDDCCRAVQLKSPSLYRAMFKNKWPHPEK